MPTLSSKPIAFEILEPQIPPSTLMAIQSMQIITERINETYMESFRKMFEGIRIAIDFQNKAMMQALAAELSISKIFSGSLFNFPPPTPFKAASLGIFGAANITEGEIVEPRKVETALLPAVIPASTPRSKMGLKEIPGGFKYKGRIIKKVSHKNAEGRLLSLLLKSSDCFAKDEEIYEKLHLNVGRSFSWVLRNLKNKLKKANFLRLEVERRWDPDGYVIVGVNYIN